MLPADSHVHTEWSWDAERGSMERTCERALEIGLPAVAFTDHADFTPWRTGTRDSGLPLGVRPVPPAFAGGDLDLEGYWRCVDHCRKRFPGLRILSGVELGEPHRFVAQSAAILRTRPMDRILGSVHCVPHADALVDVSTPGFLAGDEAMSRLRRYFAETLRLVDEAPVFGVIAHLTYPQRYWPVEGAPWSAGAFEEELRAILSVAAAAGLALEVNTTRGMPAARGLCPPPEVLRWWHQAGGRAVSLGSDAHDPLALAAGFNAAAEVIEAGGFRRGADPADYWLR